MTSPSLILIPFANGDGKYHDKTCKSKKVHSFWETCEFRNLHWPSVLDHDLNSLLSEDPCPALVVERLLMVNNNITYRRQ